MGSPSNGMIPMTPRTQHPQVFEVTKGHDYWFEMFDSSSLVIGSEMGMVVLWAFEGPVNHTEYWSDHQLAAA